MAPDRFTDENFRDVLHEDCAIIVGGCIGNHCGLAQGWMASAIEPECFGIGSRHDRYNGLEVVTSLEGEEHALTSAPLLISTVCFPHKSLTTRTVSQRGSERVGLRF
jgi:hypothetical protein